MTLVDVFAPLGLKTFLERFLGHEMSLMHGAPDRFRHLVSWQELSDTLSRMRVGNNRVSLVHRGKPVPRTSYVHRAPDGSVEYLIGPVVEQRVLQGATLVVNAVDELFPNVRSLVESCEDIFRVYVSANLYAGWRTDNGFDTHWDPHDTIIVQVLGRKDWKVWRPTVMHPLSTDDRATVPPPTEDPVWQGALEEGSVLYMPRGWWHVANPRNEPSLHITISVQHRTGMDLYQRLADMIRSSEVVRQDIPHWASPETRDRWMRDVREVIVRALDGDFIDPFMRTLDERAHARPTVHLPETSETPPIGPSSSLRLLHGRQLHLYRRKGGSQIAFKAHGKEWQCDEALAPALEMLHLVKDCTLGDMLGVTADRAKSLLPPLISALVFADVVGAEPARQT